MPSRLARLISSMTSRRASSSVGNPASTLKMRMWSLAFGLVVSPSGEVSGAVTDNPNSLRRAERQSNLTARNIVLSRVDADERALDVLQHALGVVPDGGNCAARAQFNHRQLGRGLGQSVQPPGKPMLLRLHAMAEP